MTHLAWNCDFCGKPALVTNTYGLVYCELCRQSTGLRAPVMARIDGMEVMI